MDTERLENSYGKRSLALVTVALVFLFSTLSFSLGSFWLGISITRTQFFVSILLMLPVSFFVFRYLWDKWSIRGSVALFSTFCSIFLATLIFSGLFVDLSYDGQGYHQAGVMALDRGWNPFVENIFNRTDIKSENKLWIESYPHVNNIFTLNVFRVLGDVEYGKGIGLFFIVLSGLLCYGALKNYTNHWLSVLITLIIVANPINILQIYTFGLDTQFYSLIVIFLALCLLLLDGRYRHFIFLNMFIVVVLLVNNKLTSVAYLFIFSAAFSSYLLVSRKYGLFFKTTTVLLVSTFTALLLFGYQPFVTNYLNHKNVFYPIYTNSSTNDYQYDFSENRPSNYLEENQVSLLFKSIFFKTNGQFRSPEDAAQFKIPFQYFDNEINSFIYLGPKEGAFGVFFSGIIVMLLVLIVLSVVYRKNYPYPNTTTFYFLYWLFFIILSCAINPLNSSFRYIPQFWLIIPLVLWISWKSKNKLMVLLNVYTIAVIFVNSGLIFVNTTYFNISSANQLKVYLAGLANETSNKPLLVNFAQAEGNEFLLRKYGVNYIADQGESKNFRCPEGYKRELLLKGIGNSTALACFTKSN